MPPAVEEALDKRTSAGMVGNLDRYMQYQTGLAIEAGAENPGGAAGAGIGLGAGLAVGQQMANSMQPSATARDTADALPPPLPASKRFHVAINGQASGPFGNEGLQQRVDAGELTATTLVWTKGMPEWVAAGSVAELAELFERDEPPPIPSA